MDKEKFAAQYKHPKWQQRAAEIRNSRGNECENCGESESTLHVHHGYYEQGKKPWEYPDVSLHCLCAKCHAEADETRNMLKKVIGCLEVTEQKAVLRYALNLTCECKDEVAINDFEDAVAVGAVFGLPYEAVAELSWRRDRTSVSTRELRAMANAVSRLIQSLAPTLAQPKSQFVSATTKLSTPHA